MEQPIPQSKAIESRLHQLLKDFNDLEDAAQRYRTDIAKGVENLWVISFSQGKVIEDAINLVGEENKGALLDYFTEQTGKSRVQLWRYRQIGTYPPFVRGGVKYVRGWFRQQLTERGGLNWSQAFAIIKRDLTGGKDNASDEEVQDKFEREYTLLERRAERLQQDAEAIMKQAETLKDEQGYGVANKAVEVTQDTLRALYSTRDGFSEAGPETMAMIAERFDEIDFFVFVERSPCCITKETPEAGCFVAQLHPRVTWFAVPLSPAMYEEWTMARASNVERDWWASHGTNPWAFVAAYLYQYFIGQHLPQEEKEEKTEADVVETASS